MNFSVKLGPWDANRKFETKHPDGQCAARPEPGSGLWQGRPGLAALGEGGDGEGLLIADEGHVGDELP